ncbi:MAG: hypothetical protein ACJAT7_002058 [Psychromonas sp.]|jgi:hypothetical protein|uniref:3TM-type holin n=1 Tax=Psychromonas sp. TaxID=1884585 RepID=UPI0039E21566
MWDSIKSLIGNSAPIIGTLIGGPAGTAVGSMVASALGVENTPAAIEQELRNNPDALVKIKQLESDERIALKKLAFKHAELESDERQLAIVQQNATMQAELASNDAYVRRWRPTFGYAVCLTWTLLFLGLTVSMVFYPEKAAALVTSVVALTPLFTIALSVLGISIHKRSQDKQVSAGKDPVGIVAGLKKAIKGG